MRRGRRTGNTVRHYQADERRRPKRDHNEILFAAGIEEIETNTRISQSLDKKNRWELLSSLQSQADENANISFSSAGDDDSESIVVVASNQADGPRKYSPNAAKKMAAVMRVPPVRRRPINNDAPQPDQQDRAEAPEQDEAAARSEGLRFTKGHNGQVMISKRRTPGKKGVQQSHAMPSADASKKPDRVLVVITARGKGQIDYKCKKTGYCRCEYCVPQAEFTRTKKKRLFDEDLRMI